MYYIEERYGNDGHSTWVKLLRLLCVTNYHHLNLSMKNELMFVASKCKVSEETLKDIIQDLVDLGEFDQELWEEHSVLWNQKLAESIQDAYSKRKTDCITKDQVLSIFKKKDSKIEIGVVSEPVNTEESVQCGAENTQSKVKNSISYKRKKKKRKKGESFSPAVENAFFLSLKYFDEAAIPKNELQTNKWKICWERLLELDGYDAETVFSVIKWALNDRFWSKNFNSVLKLRRKDPDGMKFIDRFLKEMEATKPEVKLYTRDELLKLKEYEGKWFQFFQKVKHSGSGIMYAHNDEIQKFNLKVLTHEQQPTTD